LEYKRLDVITILIEATQGEKFFESYASRMPPHCQK
jgi:hypothetical protein